MDTSTLSITEDRSREDQVPHTSSLRREPLQPGAEWFTRLLSPLTSHRSVESPRSTIAVSTGRSVEVVEELLVSIKPDRQEGLVMMSQPGGSQDWRDLTIDIGTPADEKGLLGFDPYALAREGMFPPSTGWHLEILDGDEGGGMDTPMSTVLLVLIPVLVIVLTVLVGMTCFLVAVLFMRRRRGISLTEEGGPLDLSKGDGVIGEGGIEGVESRWLETVEPDVREGYKRAKEWQAQYPPASLPTDITLTQFLSIQEKGVSAWAFEPDYEDNLSLFVQSRTEITFLADGPGMPAREGGGNNVMANLPLPKLNEVYYWEAKMYELPPTTEVAIGLATKPYPSFRLPGWNRHSVAYFASDGFKSHNFPFTGASHGQPLAEGDVLGVGYRPRTGTVFFTRNGRKMEDAYCGLQNLNLFPTIGANGPCTVHVNFGQAGFVFIEAIVKKWGLAPMTGTLAPPPAYGSERGSILLDAGYGTPGATSNSGRGDGINALVEAARARRSSNNFSSSPGSSSTHLNDPGARSPPLQSPRTNSSRRHRTAGKAANLGASVPTVSSPLRNGRGEGALPGPGPTTAGSRRRALGSRDLAVEHSSSTKMYVSPTDTPAVGPRVPDPDALESLLSDEESGDESVRSESDSSTMSPNPPTPNVLDISMHSLHLRDGQYFDSRFRDVEDIEDEDEIEEEGVEAEGGSGSGSGSGESDATARPGQAVPHGQQESPPPPGYAPLDPNMYANGLPADLPEEMVNQAIAAMTDAELARNENTHRTELEGTPIPPPRTTSRRFGWRPFNQGDGAQDES